METLASYERDQYILTASEEDFTAWMIEIDQAEYERQQILSIIREEL